MRRLVPLALVVTACAGTTDPSEVDPPETSAPLVTSLDDPDDEPPDATDGTSAPTTPPASQPLADDDAVVPEGFELVRARAVEPDGTVCELCLWLADDGDRRARGLMNVTDLGPGDGMAFRYPGPHTGNFWMKNTLLPLSIAFFDPAGSYISSFDMEPCAEDPCPRYRTASDFLVAVETLQGGLDELGLVPGSTLELLDLPCD